MADRHDVERALSRGSLAQQMALEPSYQMTSDQEIRARALECAVRIAAASAVPEKEAEQKFWSLAHTFEAYIRDGVA